MSSVILLIACIGCLFSMLGCGVWLIEKVFDIFPAVSIWFDNILGITEEEKIGA